ncbi:MAG: flagellar biosynthesis protein FlgL [Rhizobiales bacterium]|nr:flagellar biosynthesis protein FlgL [Hyphomicrobiales bacterium]
MTIRGIGTSSSLIVQSLLDTRGQLNDLQRQLATGKRANTYAGIGLNRGLAVGLRSQLSAITSFGETTANVGVRLELAQSTLSRIGDIGRETKANAVQADFQIDGSGQTLVQKSALNALGEILGLLNTRSGDRYLFSGASVDRPAAETIAHILDGDGARAGLRQLIDERNQADLGATGLGRLAITAPTATSVSVAEDVAGSPYGFKLVSVNSTLTGATATGPAGSPAAISVDLGVSNPIAGDKVTYTFDLPDGSREALTLTATTSSTPGANEFTIGATPAATAANLQTALTSGVGTLARTSLAAASALTASNDFFNIDDTNPPQRVAGPPFNTSVALVNGTAANTVSWYTGEAGSSSARSTATARADQSITVQYGLRANEEGIRWVVQNVAALAAVTYSPTDADAEARNQALQDRLTTALAIPTGTKKVEDIQADLAGAQTTLAAAKDRNAQVSDTLNDLLQQVEGVSSEEAAAKILSLQTSLQASLQTTALLFRTSLVNYL